MNYVQETVHSQRPILTESGCNASDNDGLMHFRVCSQQSKLFGSGKEISSRANRELSSKGADTGMQEDNRYRFKTLDVYKIVYITMFRKIICTLFYYIQLNQYAVQAGL